MRGLLAAVALALLAVETSAGFSPPAPSAPALKVEALRTEYKENPLGIDSRAPRLSWRIAAKVRNVRQAAYQIRVARSASDLRSARNLHWDSGRVASAESTQRVYDGKPLGSAQRYVWQVQIWDDQGRASGWSEPAWWEMGLLTPADWRASWIEPGLPEDVTTSPPAPMLRRAFRLTKAVQSARAYVTSHGVYELHLNGARVGDEVLTPGWTSYATRLQYQTYDVTALLRRGDNAAGVLLGNGWYRGNIGFSKRRNVYGDRLALLLQIDVTYADGSRETIGSDGQWKASAGPIVMSEIYHGETYDARLEKPGWTEATFDDRSWTPARPVERPKGSVDRAGGPSDQADERAQTGCNPADAGGTARRRHGTEHGRLGPAARAGPAGHGGDAHTRGSARQAGQLLHHEPARCGAGDQVHAERRRRRDLRAAFHVPGFPLRSGRRLSGRADGRQPDGDRRALRHGGER